MSGPAGGGVLKKAALYAAAASVAVVAGVSGAWVWGAASVTGALDAQVETLRAQGLTLGWGAREVSGFPFGHALRLSEASLAAADGAWRLTVPSTLSVAAPGGEAQVLTTAAPEATLSLTTPNGPLSLTLEAQGLEILSARHGPLRASWRAATLGFSRAAGAGVRDARLKLSEVAGSVQTLPGDATRAALMAQTVTAMLELDPELGGEGPTSTVADGLSVSLRAGGATEGRLRDGRLFEDWLAAAQAGEGSADIEVRLRAARVENAAGDVASSGPALARLGLSDGRLTYLVDAQAVRAGVALGADGPRGAARAGRVLAGVDVPVRPGPTAQAYTLRLTVDALTLEDALWRALDPAGRLSRAPASLRGEIGGGVLVAAPGEGARLQVRTVDLTGLKLDAAGAVAQAEGALTLTPGAPFPDGRLSLRATNWTPLLAAAVEIGLIGPAGAADVLDLAERLAAADADPGVFESEIDLRDGAVWANGVRVR